MQGETGSQAAGFCLLEVVLAMTLFTAAVLAGWHWQRMAWQQALTHYRHSVHLVAHNKQQEQRLAQGFRCV